MFRFLNKLNWTAIIIMAMMCISAMAIASNLHQSFRKWRDIELARGERAKMKKREAVTVNLIIEDRGTVPHE